GEHADRLLVLVTILSLVALTAGAHALGRALFGVWPAVAGALFVGSSFAFLLYAVRAFVDVPFLALVVWAAALEAARPRRGLAPMALLAAAGLLRPEAGGLAIIQRYLTVPAVALCVLAGYALLGYTTLDARAPWRARWRACAVGGLLIGVAFLAVKLSSFERLGSELRFIGSTHDELRTLL